MCWVSVCPHVWEDRGHPQLSTEMAGVVGEGAEGGRGGAEQQRVEEAGVAIEQGVERMGEREADVEVLDGEQLGAPGVEPARRGQVLALGAVPARAPRPSRRGAGADPGASAY